MRRLKAVGLALVGVLLLSSCDFSIFAVPLPGGADTGDEPMQVSAEFRDVMDLVPQSTVKVDDVDVGRITDVRADGYSAVVDMEIRNDVELPADAFARIRQTSLLGEKFVSLEEPVGGSGTDEMLADGDVIPLERSGRNPEVEEVLGALSLLLNGGGIGQLQIISQELDDALRGREPELRSALRRLQRFATVADDNSDDIIAAIDSLNTLSETANTQTETIELALDEIPSATLSLDRQRDDLVEALTSLDELSTVGVRVIRASKNNTIRSLELLEPTLRQLANADDDLAFSLQTFLTFPFVDETVGRDPQVARTIEFGDYVNLDVQLDISLGTLGGAIDVVCDEVDSLVLKALLEAGLPIEDVRDLINAICDELRGDDVQECLTNLGSGGQPSLNDVLQCLDTVGGVAGDVACDVVGVLPGLGLPVPTLPGCPDSDGGGGGSGGDDPAPGPLPVPPPDRGPVLPNPLNPGGNGPRLPDLPNPLNPGGRGGNGGGGNGGGDRGGGLLGGLLGRAAPGAAVDAASASGPVGESWYRMSDLTETYDPDLTMLLVPPMSRVTVPGELGEAR